MSRSHKHSPVYTDHKNGRKIEKRIANSIIRQQEDDEMSTHARAYYKRLYCSWNIHDYVARRPLDGYLKSATAQWIKEGDTGYYHLKYKTFKNFIQRIEKDWYKIYWRK